MSAVQYLLLAVGLAACSLVYELAFARLISELTGNPSVFESVSMATYLAGIGFGSLFFRTGTGPSMLQRLVRIEVVLGVWAIAGFAAILLLEILYRIYVYDGGVTRALWPFPPVFILGAASQVIVFLVGILSGYELTFFLTWPDRPAMRHQAACILAAYHCGALVGTVIFFLALVAAVQPWHMVVATGLFNLVMAMVLTARAGFRQGWWLAGGGLFAVVLLACLHGPLEMFQMRNRYYNFLRWNSGPAGLKEVRHPDHPLQAWRFLKSAPVIERIRTPYQVIDLVPGFAAVEQYESEADRGASMYIQGRFQVALSASRPYHMAMVHKVLAFRERIPARVLVLGGGDGGVVRELLQVQGVQNIDVAEIDAAVIDLARHGPLRDVSAGGFDDPRVRLHVGDAMDFIRNTNDIFDAVFIDLTYPFDFDSSRFVSVEFFRMLGHRLAADAFFASGMPVDMVHVTQTGFAAVARATFDQAGFSHRLAYNSDQDNFLAASRTPFRTEPRLGAADTPGSAPVLQPRDFRPHTYRHENGPGGPAKANSIMYPNLLLTADTFF